MPVLSFTDLKLLTNGTLLNKSTKLNVTFLNSNVDEIQISVDGPTSKTHDAVRGKGTFLKIINNLELLKDFSGNITISMSVLDQFVMDFNDNFNEFYEKVTTLIPNVKIGLATDLMDGRSYSKLNYKKATENLTAISEIFSNTVNNLNLDGEEEKKFERNAKVISCGYGGTFTVNSDGYVYACGIVHNEKPLGFIKDDNINKFMEDLSSTLKKYSVDSLPICKNCYLRYVCGGTCRIENRRHNNSLEYPICTDEAKEDLFLALYNDDLSFT